MRWQIKLRIAVGILVLLAAASWFSFGCGAGGSAAPSGGSNSPVAVEIPNFDQVAMDTITFE